jgi:hypothetical protein
MRTVLALAVCLGLAAPALAQRGAQKKPEERVTRIGDFDNELVEGGTINPDGTVVGGKRAPRHESLIKPRTDFVRELVHSANQI